MAEFVQTMKDWRRMCKAYTTDDDDCCKGCPVVDFHEHGCGAIFEMEDGIDWERYEGQIREWAAENPEPVYPAWRDWLRDLYGNPQMTMTDILESPIDPEIAKRLNIVPRRARNGENQESQCHIR